jgi:CrcB protein
MSALLVALGAALGAPLRYLLGHFLDRELPWGTLAAHLVASFLGGLFSALSLTGHQFALLGTGFCGGLSTYSAFAVKAQEHRNWGYVVLTVLGALGLAALGFAIPTAG